MPLTMEVYCLVFLELPIVPLFALWLLLCNGLVYVYIIGFIDAPKEPCKVDSC